VLAETRNGVVVQLSAFPRVDILLDSAGHSSNKLSTRKMCFKLLTPLGLVCNQNQLRWVQNLSNTRMKIIMII